MILIDNFMFDASLSEKHSMNSEATDFPVESGSDLTDHIRALPLEVEIEGLVSDSPIGTVALLRDLDGGASDIDGRAVLPTAQAQAHLERIRDRRLPITIQTGLGARNGQAGKIYERMAMTSLEIPVDKDTGNSLRFTASFKQIRIVTNLRSTVPTATPGGSGKQDLKNKPSLVIDEKPIIWRKGQPPGRHQPVYMTERLYRLKATSSSGVHSLVHQDKQTPLTSAELEAYIKDTERDIAERAAANPGKVPASSLTATYSTARLNPDGTVDTGRSLPPPRAPSIPDPIARAFGQ